MILRGLTLWRPWPDAFLMPFRPKRVENRPWYPKWAVGPMQNGVAEGNAGLWLALHAGQHVDKDAVTEIAQALGIQLPIGEPGQIVAVCRLARVFDIEEVTLAWRAQHHPWMSGPYCWEVDDVQPLAEPVACKGAQGLWPLPPDVERLVRKRIGGEG